MIVKKCWRVLGAAVLFVFRAAAQDVPFDIFSSLAPKASEHVDLNLDGSLLQFATAFLDNDPQAAKVKELLAGLKGIYIRSYTFAAPGAYSASDVERIRTQLKGWSEVVSVHDASETTGIYLKTEGQKIAGLVVLAAEPKELTLINIVGSIRPEQLKDLSGKFGIPTMPKALQSFDPPGQKGAKKKNDQ
jgi:hypothetical protein